MYELGSRNIPTSDQVCRGPCTVVPQRHHPTGTDTLNPITLTYHTFTWPASTIQDLLSQLTPVKGQVTTHEERGVLQTVQEDDAGLVASAGHPAAPPRAYIHHTRNKHVAADMRHYPTIHMVRHCTRAQNTREGCTGGRKGEM